MDLLIQKKLGNMVLVKLYKIYEIAKKYTKNLIPQKVKNLKLYKGENKTLFIENNIEENSLIVFSSGLS